jgi:hypothetical protein
MGERSFKLVIGCFGMIGILSRRVVVTRHKFRKSAFQPATNGIKAWFGELAAYPRVGFLEIARNALLQPI